MRFTLSAPAAAAKRKGQIFRYQPSPHEGTADEGKAPGTLELFVEPNDGDLVDNADNLTVSPFGDLIVCEDGSGENNLVGVTPAGQLYRFGHNRMNNSEFAGATFSPDGQVLFRQYPASRHHLGHLRPLGSAAV